MSKVSIVVSAKDEASRVLDGVRSSMEKVRGATDIVAAGLGLVGIAGVAGLGQIFKASVDGIDALNDVADATGASIENISALEDVAIRTGTGMDTVTTALVKFNGVLKEAKPGSAQEQVLKSIGLNAKELRDQDPAEALLTVAKALNQYEDDGNKARITQELFGKSLKDVAPLLKDLADKGVLVAKVTTERAAEAEKFNKQLFELQKNAQDAGRTVASDFVPVLTTIVKEFGDLNATEKGVSLFGGIAKSVFETLAIVSANLAFVLKGVGRELGAIAAQGAALARGDFTGFTAISEAVKEDGVRARAELDSLEKRILGLIGPAGVAGGGRGVVNPDSAFKKPSAPDTPDPAAASASKAAAEKARKERERALKEEQDFRIKLGRDYAIQEGNRVQTENENYQKQLAESEAQWQKFADARLASITREVDALGDSNITLSQQVEEIGLTTEELNKLRLARMDATIDQQESTLATAEANGLSYEEISVLETKIELLKQQRELTASGQIRKAAADTKAEQDRASKEYSDTLRNDLKGAFSAAFRDSSGEPLKAFGDAIENVIFSRAATALADAAMQSADSFFGKGGGGSGAMDWLSSIFSFDGGGYTGNDSRTGGLDGKGGFMALLHPQETVVDHTKGQQAASAGAISVVQHINIDSRSDQATIVAAMQQAKAEVLSTIQQSRRAGGVYA